MKRREFLSTVALGAAAGTIETGATNSLLAQEAVESRDFIEIRTFWVDQESKKAALIEQIDAKLIPTRNKLGFEKIGVFSLNAELHQNDSDILDRYNKAVIVVSCSPSLQKMVSIEEQVRETVATDDYINDKSDYFRYAEQDCSLLRAFPTCPTIEVPTLSPERVVQLRCYYSPNYDRNQAKMNMFDVRGELSLFRRCKMNPVFFGKTIYGSMIPNITYMLSFENDDARKKGWGEFVGSDDWKQMSGEAEFENTAIRIRNLFLKPSPKSQI